jgi:RluA family pseudouridine synthase
MKRKPSSTIRAAESGKRLSDWLAGRFSYFSPGEWLGLLDEGRISVDGERAGPDRILAAGERVSFDPPPFAEPDIDGSYRVAFEDDSFLIVDKSGSLPSHPGGRFLEHSLWYILRERYGELRIATRLDRETSGLVLLCKSARSAAHASGLLAGGSLEKEYLALVHGLFPESIRARGFLIADEKSLVRKKRRYVDYDARPEGGAPEACETGFELVEYSETGFSRAGGGPISLVRARPLTGRTHQIRATLRSLGYPLVGDKLYGLDEAYFLRFAAGELGEKDLARLMLPNQALHCSRLSFVDEGGVPIEVSSEPRWGLRFPASRTRP